MLLWAFCPYVSFVNFFISLKQYLFFLITFGGFQQESYVDMWEHYGSRVMGVYSRPLSKVLSPTTNLFWWYKPYLWKIVPHLFFLKLGFSGSHIYALNFVFSIDPFWRSRFFRLKGAHTSFNHAFMQLGITFLP